VKSFEKVQQAVKDRIAAIETPALLPVQQLPVARQQDSRNLRVLGAALPVGPANLPQSRDQSIGDVRILIAAVTGMCRLGGPPRLPLGEL